MFERVVVHASDRAASERFYVRVLSVLGQSATRRDDERTTWDAFVVAQAGPGQPVTRGLHIGFAAGSRADVDEFWRVGTAAGYRDDGAPGERPQYTDSYYGAFLLDPDGNSAEAVHHPGVRRPGGAIDHVWIRVADLAAARVDYDARAADTGARVVHERPDKVRYSTGDGSLTILAGPPTEGADVALTPAT
jgi:catechol 2,3-dioxygenase-like lactoylglutathione lyase family enzyme